MALTDVAKAFYRPVHLPPQFEVGLEAAGSFSSEPPNYPNGCHICRGGGRSRQRRGRGRALSAVDDVGRVMNHLLCEGQVHGGVAQGVGQALMEAVLYDASGQLVTGSFQDYCMPRADDLPEIVSELAEIPSTTNPLGVKAAGEAGCHRRAAGGDRRDPRCAAAARRRSHRHAGDAEPGVGGDPARQGSCYQGGCQVESLSSAPVLPG